MISIFQICSEVDECKGRLIGAYRQDPSYFYSVLYECVFKLLELVKVTKARLELSKKEITLPEYFLINKINEWLFENSILSSFNISERKKEAFLDIYGCNNETFVNDDSLWYFLGAKLSVSDIHNLESIGVDTDSMKEVKDNFPYKEDTYSIKEVNLLCQELRTLHIKAIPLLMHRYGAIFTEIYNYVSDYSSILEERLNLTKLFGRDVEMYFEHIWDLYSTSFIGNIRNGMETCLNADEYIKTEYEKCYKNYANNKISKYIDKKQFTDRKGYYRHVSFLQNLIKYHGAELHDSHIVDDYMISIMQLKIVNAIAKGKEVSIEPLDKHFVLIEKGLLTEQVTPKGHIIFDNINHIAPLFAAMLAKRKVEPNAKLFVSTIADEHPEILSDGRTCQNYEVAISDLNKKNSDMTIQQIVDQGTMVRFFEGCFTQIGRQREFIKMAQSWFYKL